MKRLISSIALVALGFSASATAQDGSMAELLNKVRQGRVTETQAHKAREREFENAKDKQKALLSQERQTQRQLERESARLEETRRTNEAEITRQLEIQRERFGQLNELFGVMQQAAGDAKSVIAGSHISIDNPGRMAEIDLLIQRVTETSELPTIEEIRTLPAQLILEMFGSRQIVTFKHVVRNNDGNSQEINLTRLGDYGLVGNGIYYELDIQSGVVKELARQPGRFVGGVAAFEASSGMSAVGIDPTRGTLLNLEVLKPTYEERIEQGGPIGYITLGLGAIAVVLALFQWAYLLGVSGKVKKQIRSETANVNNPLGRVLAVYENNSGVDVETLELKLDEAILKETPPLERFLTIVKLISAVAPLMGLLGTVVGMIETFQAITLFGTGDPSKMAGGISAALMTTVEGLIVAIPTLFLHSFVSGSSKGVIHVLEEQSAGIIAVHAEKAHANASAK